MKQTERSLTELLAEMSLDSQLRIEGNDERWWLIMRTATGHLELWALLTGEPNYPVLRHIDPAAPEAILTMIGSRRAVHFDVAGWPSRTVEAA